MAPRREDRDLRYGGKAYSDSATDSRSARRPPPWTTRVRPAGPRAPRSSRCADRSGRRPRRSAGESPSRPSSTRAVRQAAPAAAGAPARVGSHREECPLLPVSAQERDLVSVRRPDRVAVAPVLREPLLVRPVEVDREDALPTARSARGRVCWRPGPCPAGCAENTTQGTSGAAAECRTQSRLQPAPRCVASSRPERNSTRRYAAVAEMTRRSAA